MALPLNTSSSVRSCLSCDARRLERVLGAIPAVDPPALHIQEPPCQDHCVFGSYFTVELAVSCSLPFPNGAHCVLQIFISMCAAGLEAPLLSTLNANGRGIAQT